MAEMKTLTIIDNTHTSKTYTVTDPDAANIDDTIPSSDKTWSSKKISEEISDSGGGTAEGAVLYTPQTLTPEQQAQARENIGAASAEDVGEIETALDRKISKTVLWENADVTSTFAAQTVNLPTLSKYEGYEILCVVFEGNAMKGLLSSGFVERIYSTRLSTYIAGAMYVRNVNCNTDALIFSDIYKNNAFSTALNKQLIPYKIYGIKGVS